MKTDSILFSLVVLTALVVVVIFQPTDFANSNSSIKHEMSSINKTLTTNDKTEQEKIRSRQVFQSASLQPVASLAGSLPDGTVNIDELGNVLADKDLHRLFDYYLSATGEMTTDQIRTRLLSVASDFLSMEQLGQLRDIFDQYVNYLSAAERFALFQLKDAPLADRLTGISELRQVSLGSEMAAAFFADEEAYAVHVLRMQDNESIETNNAQQLKWLAAEEMATGFHDVLIENEAFNALQIADDERLVVRTELYGAEVANNLAALDTKQALWLEKVSHYIDLRMQMADNHVLLQQLEQNYDARELKRLRAYYQAHRQN